MGIIIGDINQLTESNLGGSGFLELIDVKLVPDFKIVNHEVNDEIVIDPSNWSKITPTQGTLDFGYTTLNKGGISMYDTKVAFTIPKHRIDIDRVVYNLNRTRWIALLYGANGNVLVLGTKDSPLKFKEVDLKYKSSITQRNAYRCEFNVVSTVKPPFYNPSANANRRWEDGQLAKWEDGTQIEFENI